ncbi:MAG TPA: glycosyltransferase family 39 protein [Parvularculaceae bacterium]|nr:glycosyltransferase family 39 protein [Parvularculaceae bacterium]
MVKIIKYWRARPVLFFVVIVGLTAAARLAALFFFEANIGPDEAQYWVWSKAPAFGYYSKPPLIAWVIGATTALFGDAEWAVRLPAPLFQAGAALYVFALARRLYGEAAGFWSGLGWLFLPGVTLSSALITTDAPLLFFWAAALFYFFSMLRARQSERETFFDAILLGASIGLGFLAKYAMIYFLFGAMLAFFLSRETRRAFPRRAGLLALLVAGAVFAPNIWWNAAHNFDTLAHTAANANWRGSLIHPLNFLVFLLSQFGVFSIAPMLLLIWGIATLKGRLAEAGPEKGTDLALLAFALTPLAIVAPEALISRAHANWAAAAFPAAIILITVWALRRGARWVVVANAGFNLAVAVVFLIAFSNFAIIDAVGLSSVVKPLRGWQAQGAAVHEAAKGYDAILVDDRELMGSLLYYARGGPPIVALNSNRRVDNHYEAFMAYDPDKAPRALFIGKSADPTAAVAYFGEVMPVGANAVDLESGRRRTLYLFEVSAYKGAQGG